MSALGFLLRDYSTGTPVGTTPERAVVVLVPRRHSGLPPLQERTHSSWRRRNRHNYFEPRLSDRGVVVFPAVPPGAYDIRIEAEGYVPWTGVAVAPHLAPVVIPLHRDASYRFAPEDTILRGLVETAAGAPHTGFDVVLQDPEPGVPAHRVPLNGDGEFVIYAPEKRVANAVDFEVFHSTGSVIGPAPAVAVALHRPNVVPTIVVP